jgi:hypothetical protein
VNYVPTAKKNKGGRPFIQPGEKTVFIGFKGPASVKDRITRVRERLGFESDSVLLRQIVNGWLKEYDRTT